MIQYVGFITGMISCAIGTFIGYRLGFRDGKIAARFPSDEVAHSSRRRAY